MLRLWQSLQTASGIKELPEGPTLPGPQPPLPVHHHRRGAAPTPNMGTEPRGRGVGKHFCALQRRGAQPLEAENPSNHPAGFPTHVQWSKLRRHRGDSGPPSSHNQEGLKAVLLPQILYLGVPMAAPHPSGTAPTLAPSPVTTATCGQGGSGWSQHCRGSARVPEASAPHLVRALHRVPTPLPGPRLGLWRGAGAGSGVFVPAARAQRRRQRVRAPLPAPLAPPHAARARSSGR